MQLDLYVQNEKEELIGRVNVEGVDLHGEEKLVVSTYTREPKVLAKTWGRPISIVCEGDSKHFTGFAQYLRQRGKAAEIHHNSHKIIILPPASSSSVNTTRFECLTDMPAERRGSETTAATSGPADFLSNILNRIDKQAPIAKPAIAMDQEAKREQRRREMEEFEERTRDQLIEFTSDPTRTELHFPPMEKPQRSVIHGFVADFEGLLSGSAGETPEERHIVVYKEGFQPSDIDVHLDKSRVIHLSNKRMYSQQKAAVAPPRVNELLQETKHVKRDRRTVAEIQAVECSIQSGVSGDVDKHTISLCDAIIQEAERSKKRREDEL